MTMKNKEEHEVDDQIEELCDEQKRQERNSHCISSSGSARRDKLIRDMDSIVEYLHDQDEMDYATAIADATSRLLKQAETIRYREQNV